MSNAIETAKFLRRYQSWRKGEIDVFYPDSHAGPNPVEISAAIDRAIAALEAQPPCGADGAELAALVIQDLCESEPANPDDPDTVCVKVNYVAEVIQRHAKPAAPVLPIDVVRFEQSPPCYICGYNSVGYFSPATHPCAEKYHAAMGAPVSPATVAVPVPDGVVVAFGLLWHVRMGCDFPVPPGFSKNISPEEAAAKARRFLSDLLTQEQKGDGINRASELLAASQREGGGT